MRANQFIHNYTKNPVHEVKMDPTSIQRFLSTSPYLNQINTGFELEAVYSNIPNSQSGLEDEYIEDNFSLQDIKDIFSDYVNPNSRVYDRIQRDYEHYLRDEIYVELRNSEDRILELAKEYCNDNLDPDEVEQRANMIYDEEPDELMDADDYLMQARDELIDRDYVDWLEAAKDQIKHDIEQNIKDKVSFGEWLQENFDTLANLADEYGMNLEFTGGQPSSFYNPDNFEEPGQRLEKLTGISVDIAEDSHMYSDYTTIEIKPDVSITPDNENYSCAEISTPILPFTETIKLFDQVVSWAKSYGGYTNQSCGFHFNISGPDPNDFNYLKMLLLIGDVRLLEKFERQTNNACRAAFDQLHVMLRYPDSVDDNKMVRAEKILQSLKNKTLDDAKDIASRAMTTYIPKAGQWATDKTISLHWRGTFLEVRSMGGSKVLENPELVKDYMYRIARVYISSIDENLDRQDYLAKLYKFVDKVLDQIKSDVVDKPVNLSRLLANYLAGDKSQLPQLIELFKQQQTD